MAMSASEAIAASQPFRLLDLPPELRDHIYEIMVVPTEIVLCYSSPKNPSPQGCVYTIDECLNFEGWPNDSPMLNICRVSRQVLAEVRPIFYGKNRFTFDVTDSKSKRNSVTLALSFLKDRTHAWPLIRDVEFTVEEDVDRNGQIVLEDMDVSTFREFCQILAACPLRYLCVEVWNWAVREYLDYEHCMIILQQQQTHHGIPSWMFQLSRVKGLEMLHIQMQYGSPYAAKQNIAALEFLRGAMVQRGHTMRGMDGIKLKLLHPHGAEATEKRALTCELCVEMGHSKLESERRAKVQPQSWCKLCGKFLQRNGCDCSPDTGIFHCHFGTGRHIEHFLRIDHDSMVPVHTEGKKDNPSSAALVAGELDHLYGRNIWDSRRWGGGPLKDYLPKGVTEEDFYYARSLLVDGVYITLQDEHGLKGASDSDFGDTDSFLSLRWNDAEGRVES